MKKGTDTVTRFQKDFFFFFFSDRFQHPRRPHIKELRIGKRRRRTETAEMRRQDSVNYLPLDPDPQSHGIRFQSGYLTTTSV
jgi:hypothetical protein